MSQTPLYLLLAAIVAVGGMQLWALLRKSTFATPPDLNARLALLEQNVQALLQTSARHEGSSGRLEQQLRLLTDTTAQQLESSRNALDAQLGKTVEESRKGRLELMQAFQQLENRLEQRIVGQLSQAQTEAAQTRKETTDTLTTFRAEMTATLTALSAETLQSRTALTESSRSFEQRVQQHIQERFETLTQASQSTFDSLKADMHHQLGTVKAAVVEQLSALAQGATENSKALRDELNNRLGAIQADNSTKLEEMRRTVDEKLHATLEQRLGDSFKRVSEHLEQVHVGLGEMRTLAGSVGDLKRVMTNVRTRGTWGEVQLGAIIENLLTAEQYGQNVKTVPGRNELVEYAVRMPGKTADEPVWLPIDSKYPVEAYQRLLDAHEAADKAGVEKAATAFATAIEAEAKKIASKYLSPPHTTDFAILFLPTEGLFAEVARISGMIELLQNKHRIMVAGPTTLAAMLNSLRLGFRTLVIEQRSSEVWAILGKVKAEFQKFGDAVDATKKSIDAAAKKFDEIGTRTRAMDRSLKDVEALPMLEESAQLKTP